MAGKSNSKSAAKKNSESDDLALKEVVGVSDRVMILEQAVVALENRLGDGYYPKLEDRAFEAAQGNGFVGVDGLQAESHQRLKAARKGEQPQTATDEMKAREDAEGITETQRTGQLPTDAGDRGQGDGGDAANPSSPAKESAAESTTTTPKPEATTTTAQPKSTTTTGVPGGTGTQRAR